MTISATSIKTGTMEKLTDPVTSDSELEEGEIASDEIEIISEFIRHPPNKRTKLNSRDGIVHHGQSCDSTRKSASLKALESVNKKSLGSSNSGEGKGRKTEVKRNSDTKTVAKRAVNGKANFDGVKKKSTAEGVNRLGNYRSSSKSGSSRSSRLRSKDRSLRERDLPSQLKSDDKPPNSKPSSPGASRDFKWKKSFELVTPGSVESIDADSGSDIDEEIQLRLEALNSVVMNAKPKDVQLLDVVSSQSCSTPESLNQNEVQVHEIFN